MNPGILSIDFQKLEIDIELTLFENTGLLYYVLQSVKNAWNYGERYLIKNLMEPIARTKTKFLY